MRSSLRSCGGLAFAAATLVACAVPDKPQAPPPTVSVARPGQHLVTVSDTDAGAAVTLASAQELVVRLPIEPVAGLEWSLVDLTPGVLTLAGSRFERPLRSPNGEESRGTTVWRFTPQAAGVIALRFELRRPRSLQLATQTIVYDVTVK